MLNTVSIHARHLLFLRTFFTIFTISVGFLRIKNTNPRIKNLSRLLRKNLSSFIWVSTVLIHGNKKPTEIVKIEFKRQSSIAI